MLLISQILSLKHAHTGLAGLDKFELLSPFEGKGLLFKKSGTFSSSLLAWDSEGLLCADVYWH